MRTNGRTQTTHTHTHTAARRTSEPLRSCIRAPRVESTALHCSFDQIKSSVCEAVFPQSIITHPSSFVVRRSSFKQTNQRTRSNERTSANFGERRKERRNEGTKERRNEGRKERRKEGRKERTKSERTKEGRKEGRKAQQLTVSDCE